MCLHSGKVLGPIQQNIGMHCPRLVTPMKVNRGLGKKGIFTVQKSGAPQCSPVIEETVSQLQV